MSTEVHENRVPSEFSQLTVQAIAKQKGLDPNAAADLATQMRDALAKEIKELRQSTNRNCTDQEALEAATNALNVQHTSASESAKSILPLKGGRRWEIAKHCIWWMTRNRHLSEFSIGDPTNFLFHAGLVVPPCGKPEARGVGDALGGHGLHLKKKPGKSGCYFMPRSAADFESAEVVAAIGIQEGENALDALCRYFEVKVKAEAESAQETFAFIKEENGQAATAGSAE